MNDVPMDDLLTSRSMESQTDCGVLCGSESEGLLSLGVIVATLFVFIEYFNASQTK